MVTKVEDDRILEDAVLFELFDDCSYLAIDQRHSVVVIGLGVSEQRCVRKVGRQLDTRLRRFQRLTIYLSPIKMQRALMRGTKALHVEESY